MTGRQRKSIQSWLKSKSVAQFSLHVNPYRDILSGWWFGTFVIFPNSWDDDPIWLYNIFQRGWNHQPETSVLLFYFLAFPPQTTLRLKVPTKTMTDQVCSPTGAARPSTSVLPFGAGRSRPIFCMPGGCQWMRADSRCVLPGVGLRSFQIYPGLVNIEKANWKMGDL